MARENIPAQKQYENEKRKIYFKASKFHLKVLIIYFKKKKNTMPDY